MNDALQFEGIDAALQAEVDGGHFPGFSYAIVRRGEIVARRCVGWSDLARLEPMRLDHLFRIFSCTKLLTSLAALQLWEQGRFDFDDPVGRYIPELGAMRVLAAPDAPLDTARPAREPIRIRHLLTHTAGLGYGFSMPGTPIGRAYDAARVSSPFTSNAAQMAALGTLPLLHEPGTAWHYGVATDVVGRLVEVLSGLTLDRYFARHLLAPLGLKDTAFWLPPDQQARLAGHAIGSLRTPLAAGLRDASQLPYRGAYRKPVARLNGGGGLVSSLDDFTRIVQVLARGGAPLLRPGTMRWVTGNQLPPGMPVALDTGPMPGRGHSYVGSVVVAPITKDPAARVGDVLWSGMSGTHWLVAPRDGFGLVLMTQRYRASHLPYWPRFKAAVERAVGR